MREKRINIFEEALSSIGCHSKVFFYGWLSAVLGSILGYLLVHFLFGG